MNYIKRLLRKWYHGLPRKAGKFDWKAYAWRLFKTISLWFLGITLGITLLFWLLPIPFTPLMLIRCWEQAWDDKREVRLYKDWVPLEDISPHFQLAVVCSEDQDFLEHDGFDFKAIKKAYQYNKTHKKQRGASTISQQTAKNVFLWPTRSFLRKGLELYLTFIIEIVWSKERIMEVYLNIIEMGDGIYGAEAAARHYFNKPAKDLNRQEAALLAAVLPGPLIYSVTNPSPKIRDKQHWIVRQMRSWGGEIDFEEPNTPGKKEK